MVELPPMPHFAGGRSGLPPMPPLPVWAAKQIAHTAMPALRGFGAADDATSPMRSTIGLVWSLASIAGMGLGAYHGYKRNDSVGWAIGWGLLGGLLPIIVLPVAYAQGFGEPKRG